MVIYGDDQSGYPHPDHLRVHEIGVAAFPAAGDRIGSRTPARPGSRPSSTTRCSPWPRFREIHEKFEELGLESPFDEQWRNRWKDVPVEPITTSIDISDFADVRREALLAHATQVDPKSPFWFGLPPEVMRSIHPFDDYRLAQVRLTRRATRGGQRSRSRRGSREPDRDRDRPLRRNS